MSGCSREYDINGIDENADLDAELDGLLSLDWHDATSTLLLEANVARQRSARVVRLTVPLAARSEDGGLATGDLDPFGASRRALLLLRRLLSWTCWVRGGHVAPFGTLESFKRPKRGVGGG